MGQGARTARSFVQKMWRDVKQEWRRKGLPKAHREYDDSSIMTTMPLHCPTIGPTATQTRPSEPRPLNLQHVSAVFVYVLVCWRMADSNAIWPFATPVIRAKIIAARLLHHTPSSYRYRILDPLPWPGRSSIDPEQHRCLLLAGPCAVFGKLCVGLATIWHESSCSKVKTHGSRCWRRLGDILLVRHARPPPMQPVAAMSSRQGRDRSRSVLMRAFHLRQVGSTTLHTPTRKPDGTSPLNHLKLLQIRRGSGMIHGCIFSASYLVVVFTHQHQSWSCLQVARYFDRQEPTQRQSTGSAHDG